ncbi:MAG: TRL-like family protein [Candidatus Brocadiia bacterium]|jgi:hypothetical protein
MRLLLCALAFAGVVSLSGCTVMTTGAVHAAIVIDEKGPVAMGDADAGTKVGTSQAEGILVVAYGDASISAAMKEGNLTKVHHVDKETFNVLGVYGRYRTIVYGE